VNWDPLSEWTLYGRPTGLNISNKDSATVLVLISLNGMASGKCVLISIVVRIYLYPSEGGLIGPVISTQITQNVVPSSCIVTDVNWDPLSEWTFPFIPCNCAFWYVPLAQITRCHVSCKWRSHALLASRIPIAPYLVFYLLLFSFSYACHEP